MNARTVTPMLEDPMVWKMAEWNHTPEEQWTTDVSRETWWVSLECSTCHQSWPCATREALRLMRTEEGKAE